MELIINTLAVIGVLFILFLLFIALLKVETDSLHKKDEYRKESEAEAVYITYYIMPVFSLEVYKSDDSSKELPYEVLELNVVINTDTAIGFRLFNRRNRVVYFVVKKYWGWR
jgi:hypothetical protein